jgi:hypothetical protein
MPTLLNSLTKYGPVSVERHADQWRVGCLISLPANIQESFIAACNRDLSKAVKELLKNAPLERAKLWQKQLLNKT